MSPRRAHRSIHGYGALRAFPPGISRGPGHARPAAHRDRTKPRGPRSPGRLSGPGRRQDCRADRSAKTSGDDPHSGHLQRQFLRRSRTPSETPAPVGRSSTSWVILPEVRDSYPRARKDRNWFVIMRLVPQVDQGKEIVPKKHGDNPGGATCFCVRICDCFSAYCEANPDRKGSRRGTATFFNRMEVVVRSTTLFEIGASFARSRSRSLPDHDRIATVGGERGSGKMER